MKTVKPNFLEFICITTILCVGIRIIIHVITNPELFAF